MILDEIISARMESLPSDTIEIEVERLRNIVKFNSASLPCIRDFKTSFSQGSVNIIAELKKASPSRGIILDNYNPVSLARLYYNSGAAALSVLTEKRYFMGNIEHLARVKKAVPLPLLRKDFLLTEYDIYMSRIQGADAVLLIARILDDKTLSKLIALAEELGMCSLVEVHNEDEIERVVALGADIIGINNRDLDSLVVDIYTTLNLMEKIPDGCLAISESGIKNRSDILRLTEAGVNGFLVGESLLSSEDIGAKLRELRGSW